MSFGKREILADKEAPLGPQDRINYHGDMRPFLQKALEAYGFGQYAGHEVKMNGYEDFNLVLKTTDGSVFVKCFAKWRKEDLCLRYLEMIHAAQGIGGVRTPEVYKNSKGSTLTSVTMGDTTDYLCVMKFLDRGNIWESERPINEAEQAEVIRQAGKIANCDFKPDYVPDSWSIMKMLETYEKNRDRIESTDREIIEPLLAQFGSTDIDALPHCFVHGDIRSTNVMRHSDGQAYIIDFSVANWYPRILEMAVVCCGLLFNPAKSDEFPQKYKWALEKYAQSGVQFTENEHKLLPLFVRLAHAANIIGSSSPEATNYISEEENLHWRRLGKTGLNFTTSSWKP